MATPLALFFALLVLLPRAIAQSELNSTLFFTDLTSLPPCAEPCFHACTEPLLDTCHDSTNATCLCAIDSFFTSMQICAIEACPFLEALSATNMTSSACQFPVRDRSSLLLGTTIALFIVSFLVVLARIVFRLRSRDQFLGPDEYATLLALVCNVPNMVITATGGQAYGRDVWTLPPATTSALMRWNLIQTILYFTNTAILKIAFLLFYRRIFPTKSARRVIAVTIGVVGLYGAVFIVVAALQCQPVEYYWLQWFGGPGGTCIDRSAMVWAQSIIGIVLDVWMLAIPLWNLRGVQMPWKRKAGVAAMFLVGAFVTIASTVRITTLVKIYGFPPNPPWDLLDLLVWSTVEINLGIICASMPALRQIYTVILYPVLFRTHVRCDSASPKGSVGDESWVRGRPTTPVKSQSALRLASVLGRRRSIRLQDEEGEISFALSEGSGPRTKRAGKTMSAQSETVPELESEDIPMGTVKSSTNALRCGAKSPMPTQRRSQS